MAGTHNPHTTARLGGAQPQSNANASVVAAAAAAAAASSSWNSRNHLQVPSYIPRQPQLAHLANERPTMVRSPLTWHHNPSSAHTEAALYNYMAAATHKTPLDINPLLPAFARPSLTSASPTQPTFCSVDLSLGSSVRNNSNCNSTATDTAAGHCNNSSPLSPKNSAASSTYLGLAAETPTFGSSVIQLAGNTNANSERCSSNSSNPNINGSNADMYALSSSLQAPTATAPFGGHHENQPPLNKPPQRQLSASPSVTTRPRPTTVDCLTANDPIQLIKEVLHGTSKPTLLDSAPDISTREPTRHSLPCKDDGSVARQRPTSPCLQSSLHHLSALPLQPHLPQPVPIPPASGATSAPNGSSPTNQQQLQQKHHHEQLQPILLPSSLRNHHQHQASSQLPLPPPPPAFRPSTTDLIHHAVVNNMSADLLNHSNSSCSSTSSTSSSSSSSLSSSTHTLDNVTAAADLHSNRRRSRKPKKTTRATSNKSDNDDNDVMQATTTNSEKPSSMATSEVHEENNCLDRSTATPKHSSNNNAPIENGTPANVGAEAAQLPAAPNVAQSSIEHNTKPFGTTTTPPPPPHSSASANTTGAPSTSLLPQQPVESVIRLSPIATFTNATHEPQQPVNHNHNQHQHPPDRRKSPSPPQSTTSPTPPTAILLPTTAAATTTTTTKGMTTTPLNDTNAQASDDCETIDKIAAEIAKTNTNSADKSGTAVNSSAMLEPTVEVREKCDSIHVNGLTLAKGNPVVLLEKLPLSELQQAAAGCSKDAASYEEVETKLAEMFAGIDDDGDLNDTLDMDDDEYDDVDEESTDDDYEPVDKRSKRKTALHDDSDQNSTAHHTDTPSKGKKTKATASKVARKTVTSKTAAAAAAAADSPPAAPKKRGRKKKNAGGKVAAKSIGDGKLKKKLAGKKTKKQNTCTGGSNKRNKHESANARDSPLYPTSGASTSQQNMSQSAAPRVGPFVHVRTDGTSNVINAPISGGALGGTFGDDAADGAGKVGKAKAKMGFSLAGPGQSLSVTGDRNNKIRGLHLSTLSNKYDADTTDTTWMCVFCKQGPHRFGLGDLFGPYLVQSAGEEFEQCVLLQQQQQLGVDDGGNGGDVWRRKSGIAGGIQKRTLPSMAAGCSGTGGSAKKKRKHVDAAMAVADDPQSGHHSNSVTSPTTPSPAICHNASNNNTDATSAVPNMFAGMTRSGPDTFEVWMHGDCTVWSPGVHIVGARIVGLEAAVWTAVRHRCTVCAHPGAMMACLARGCERQVHVPCGRTSGWSMCETDFKTRCAQHSSEGPAAGASAAIGNSTNASSCDAS